MSSIHSRVRAEGASRRPRREAGRRLRDLVVLLMAVTIVTAGGRPAPAWSAEREAPDPQAGEPNSVNPEARRLFEDGKQQLQAGDYAQAIRSFQGAYDLAPVPGLLYILAQAHRLSGDCAAALSFYRRYLPVAPPEQRLRAKTEARIADMERCLAVNRPAAPPAVVPPPATAPVLIATSEAPAPSSATPRRRKVGLVLAGTAVGLMAAGGYFAWQSDQASNDVSRIFATKASWSDAASEREHDGQRDQTLARAALITGTLVAAAATWYLLP